MKQSDQVECPVCGMRVGRHDREISYRQMNFAFCSEQCRARFLAHPHLYVGYPGQAAPKQNGQVALKRRRLHLQQPLSTEGEVLVGEMLRGLMGIDAVTVSGDTIEITYDLLQVSLEELESAITAAGTRLGEGWPERLRRALIHASEESEIEAREATPPHHYLP
ncbi:hypothetical protein Tel_03600 [Candidatus Tenderia electrophaga]|jgi:YHS domain-containing protein/copper chaperone CopZ|uniref:YHS domain-containing protein n=1 Tax=Candidatus Tenderia electrophaga TaxID=1748243 RepID=A0A0S2TAX0_9GAMM|nr:hypothetical protein Tel_03600 [Candidatus Tenderia electrophaga]